MLNTSRMKSLVWASFPYIEWTDLHNLHR